MLPLPSSSYLVLPLEFYAWHWLKIEKTKGINSSFVEVTNTSISNQRNYGWFESYVNLYHEEQMIKHNKEEEQL
jgi:hypothetical protein